MRDGCRTSIELNVNMQSRATSAAGRAFTKLGPGELISWYWRRLVRAYAAAVCMFQIDLRQPTRVAESHAHLFSLESIPFVPCTIQSWVLYSKLERGFPV